MRQSRILINNLVEARNRLHDTIFNDKVRGWITPHGTFIHLHVDENHHDLEHIEDYIDNTNPEFLRALESNTVHVLAKSGWIRLFGIVMNKEPTLIVAAENERIAKRRVDSLLNRKGIKNVLVTMYDSFGYLIAKYKYHNS